MKIKIIKGRVGYVVVVIPPQRYEWKSGRLCEIDPKPTFHGCNTLDEALGIARTALTTEIEVGTVQPECEP